MSSAFMSGLIKGFMAFGGGGMMGGAGGAAGASGAGASTAGASAAGAGGAGASAAGASGAAGGAGAASGASGATGGGMSGDLMGGMMGGGGTANATPVPTPAPAPTTTGGGENIGTTSQALSTTPANAGGSSSGGGIIRENPYGTGAAEGKTDTQKAGEALKKVGEDYAKLPRSTQNQFGNSYQALFGGEPAFSARAPGGHMGMGGGIALPPMASISGPAATIAPVTSPTALPSPMPLNLSAPQIPNIAPINPIAPPMPVPPAPLSLGATSDMRAKRNIRHANAEMDKFLQKVYENVTKKGKK